MASRQMLAFLLSGTLKPESEFSVSQPHLWIEIIIEESLEDRWKEWFDGLELSPLENHSTLIKGPTADQAALYGLLERIRDLNLSLVSLQVRHFQQK